MSPPLPESPCGDDPSSGDGDGGMMISVLPAKFSAAFAKKYPSTVW
jgi:hypothetical protein